MTKWTIATAMIALAVSSRRRTAPTVAKDATMAATRATAAPAHASSAPMFMPTEATPVAEPGVLPVRRGIFVEQKAPDTVVLEADGREAFGMNLEQASGRRHHSIAVPSVFVIDHDGVVRWAHADPNYMVRPTTRQLLDALDGLGIRS